MKKSGGSERKKNKIAQGDVNIFRHLTFFFNFDIFDTLTGNDTSNRLKMIIFVISRSISVEIDTSLALFKNIFFGGHFDFFFPKRGPPYWQKLQTDLANF